MGYRTALDAITAAALADDAAKVAHANEPVYAWRPYFLSYRTLRAMFPAEQVAAVAAAVQQADPLAHQMLLVPGDENGNGGGVDVSLPDSQAMIATLQAAQLFSADDAARVLDLARTLRGPRFRVEWGMVELAFDAGLLARLPHLAAWEAMTLDVNGWLTLAQVSTPTVAAMLGVGADVWEARRTAMVAAVQDWRAKVDADQDVSGMPATAAALWQQVSA